MKDALAQAQQQAPAGDIDLSTIFTAEEIETLGEDAARIQARAIMTQARKIAQETTAREIEPLRQREAAEREEAQARRTKTFLEQLAEGSPHWQTVDKDPNWLMFLEGDDPKTGIWRDDIVQQAKARGDARPVLNLIAEFEAQKTPAQPKPQPPVAPQALPGAGAPVAQGSDVPVVRGHPTAKEVREHYKLKALNKITPEQVREFDARMKAAQAAGYYV